MVLTRNRISISTIISWYILYLFMSFGAQILLLGQGTIIEVWILFVWPSCWDVVDYLLFTVVNVNFNFFICEISFLLASSVILRTRYRYISLHQTIAWFLLTNLICYNAITITNAPVDSKISGIIGIIDDLCIFS